MNAGQLGFPDPDPELDNHSEITVYRNMAKAHPAIFEMVGAFRVKKSDLGILKVERKVRIESRWRGCL